MPVTRFWLLGCSLSFVALVSPAAVPAATAPVPPRQDPRLVHEAVMSFLHSQSAGLPGDVKSRPALLIPAYHLPACAALEAASSPRSAARGATLP